MDQNIVEVCQGGALKCVIQWPQIMSHVGTASKSVECYEELRTR